MALVEALSRGPTRATDEERLLQNQRRAHQLADSLIEFSRYFRSKLLSAHRRFPRAILRHGLKAKSCSQKLSRRQSHELPARVQPCLWFIRAPAVLISTVSHLIGSSGQSRRRCSEYGKGYGAFSTGGEARSGLADAIVARLANTSGVASGRILRALHLCGVGSALLYPIQGITRDAASPFPLAESRITPLRRETCFARQARKTE